MHLFLVFAASLAQPAAAPPATAEPPRFGGLFTDWRGANRDALEQELARRALPTAPTRGEQAARALGDRVGEMVAAGDCVGGERIAREASDFALVRAVQDHCHRVPVSQLPDWAQPR